MALPTSNNDELATPEMETTPVQEEKKVEKSQEVVEEVTQETEPVSKELTAAPESNLEVEKAEATNQAESESTESEKEPDKEDSTKESVFEGHDPEKEKKDFEVVDDILTDDGDFEELVGNAKAEELCFLLDRFALEEDIWPLIPKVSLIKRTFDKAVKQNKLGITEKIANRFESALLKFNARRNALRREMENEKAENSRLKAELLDALQEIVKEENVEAIKQVREIQEKWREIGWVLSKDLESFTQRYKAYLDIFYELRNKYHHLKEMDEQHNLHEKLQVIEKIRALIPVTEEGAKTETEQSEVALEEGKTEEGTETTAETQKLEETSEVKPVEETSPESPATKPVEEATAVSAPEKLESDSVIAKQVTQTSQLWKDLSDKVQNLQELWKTIGYVSREMQEEVYNHYNETLDEFYQLRQKFFQKKDEEREKNAEKKREILEKMKAVVAKPREKAREWNNHTKELIALQNVWKPVGPGPRDINRQLWKDFRAVSDTFFAAKSDFFKALDGERSKNLELKMTLIEKAEALQASTDWRETAQEFKKLQEEWKNIGPVQDKVSNKIWKRFRAACDFFFNNRANSTSDQKKEQSNNLELKKAIIVKFEELTANKELSKSDKLATFKKLKAEWGNIGFVPYKAKDKINNQYQKVLDELFKTLDVGEIDSWKMRMESRFTGGSNENQWKDKIKDEMYHLQRKMQPLQDKLNSYETNIQMISKGKSGDSLRAMIQKQIDDQKKQIAKFEKKHQALREMMKNPPAPKVEEVEEVPTPEAKTEATPQVDAPPVKVPEEVSPEAKVNEAPVAEKTEAVKPEAPEAVETKEVVAEAPVAEKTEEVQPETPEPVETEEVVAEAPEAEIPEEVTPETKEENKEA